MMYLSELIESLRAVAQTHGDAPVMVKGEAGPPRDVISACIEERGETYNQRTAVIFIDDYNIPARGGV